MSVARRSTRRRRLLRSLGVVGTLLGLTLTLTAQGGGGGKTNDKPAVAEIPAEPLSGGCSGRASLSSDSALGRGKLTFTVNGIPQGTSKRAELLLQFEKPKFDPRSGNTKSVSIEKARVEFPRGYRPAGADASGVVVIPVTDGVGVIKLGKAPAGWDLKRPVRVNVTGVVKSSSSDKPAADCGMKVRFGQSIPKSLDCIGGKSGETKKLLELAVRFEQLIQSWTVVVDAINGVEPGHGSSTKPRSMQLRTGGRKVPASFGRSVTVLNEGDSVRFYVRLYDNTSCLTDAIKIPPKKD